MRTTVLCGLMIVGCVAVQAETTTSADTATPTAQKSIVLFNGMDLDNWEIQPETPDAILAWKVKDGVLHSTGIPTNYLRTQQQYSHYSLAFEWRWLEEAGNSGLMLHIQGEDQVWPKCLEVQLKHENAGDFFVMEGVTFTELPQDERRALKHEPSNEKPLGEWNTMRVEVQGDQVMVYVNGILQNQATGLSVEQGCIGFQSEGTPIEFRDIMLTPSED